MVLDDDLENPHKKSKFYFLSSASYTMTILDALMDPLLKIKIFNGL